MFEYHGAEHKTIHAYEHEEELTVDNVKKYSENIRVYRENLQEELDQWYRFASKLRQSCPYSDIHYIEGNHENRLIRYLSNDGKKISSLRVLEIRSLLMTNDFGIKYHEEMVLIDGWLCTHGEFARKNSAYSARAMMEKYMCNIICGHTHRQGLHCKTIRGRKLTSIEAGCLFDQNQADYVRCPDWQHGFILFGLSNYFEFINFEREGLIFRGKRLENKWRVNKNGQKKLKET